MDNIYKPPQSDLTQTAPSTDEYGSIAKGINGDYELSIGDTIREAWELTNGVKGKIIGSVFLMYVTLIPLLFVMSMVLAVATASDNMIVSLIAQFLFQIVFTAVVYPLGMGVMMIGLHRSVHNDLPIKSLYGYFGYTIPLLITSIIMSILVFIGFLLFIIPGLYLSIAYMLALPLVVEKGLSPWQALETSRKAITNKWVTFFGLLIVLWFIVFISAIPLGIGLIWTIPMAVVAIGIVYRNMFGVEPLS